MLRGINDDIRTHLFRPRNARRHHFADADIARPEKSRPFSHGQANDAGTDDQHAGTGSDVCGFPGAQPYG